MRRFAGVAACVLGLSAPLVLTPASAQVAGGTTTPASLAQLTQQSQALAQQRQALQADEYATQSQSKILTPVQEQQLMSKIASLAMAYQVLQQDVRNLIDSLQRATPLFGASPTGPTGSSGTSGQSAELEAAQALLDQTIAAQATLGSGQSSPGPAGGSPAEVPEPATWALFAIALAALYLRSRKVRAA